MPATEFSENPLRKSNEPICNKIHQKQMKRIISKASVQYKHPPLHSSIYRHFTACIEKDVSTSSGTIGCKVWLPCGDSHVETHLRILAIHGWMDNAASFDRLAPFLVERLKCEIVAIDLPGHGKSEHMPYKLGSPYTWETYAAAGLSILEKLQWSNFTILGHSMVRIF